MSRPAPSKVRPSAAYLKKESVRGRLQDLIVNSISSGEVTNQDQLEEFLKTLQMSLDALKMVTYDGFNKLTSRG